MPQLVYKNDYTEHKDSCQNCNTQNALLSERPLCGENQIGIYSGRGDEKTVETV